MAYLPAPVAATRRAVRSALAWLPAGSLVLVACSGGADSLALAAATSFVAPRMGLRAGLVTIDHGLQAGSAARAEAVVGWAAGFSPVLSMAVEVSGAGGPEAAARNARYAALEAAALEYAAAAVLLGHTRDDQAETVLLALARGAGPRGMSGMPVRRGLLLRPFLGVARSETRKACAALGLEIWDDPHNRDSAYARARVRADLLPALIAALGPGVVDNLARTAGQLAADNAALDALAAAEVRDELVVTDLSVLPDAIRTRVLHQWARRLGVPGGSLSHRHVAALDALITDWHGQGSTALPGGVQVARREGRLTRVDL
ncbi:tRNA lysidine(34) synthetase TilS [Actinoplanes sp. NBRC 103695]|uniref:tRNA lysidine(34) synthetase TilS n=1 Tax=Actinoplanes sp. NBRC 103695 TaxID=3032202 RepID=UPI0024A4BF9A|nr:tRNA lysidine(34) synthetase TilS [Actinoplanes sp. NBRC 103695]GLY97078.1 tRNA(Ile)-lysidine synthase [Actinoplanes sp. NBRC 103695]